MIRVWRKYAPAIALVAVLWVAAPRAAADSELITVNGTLVSACGGCTPVDLSGSFVLNSSAPAITDVNLALSGDATASDWVSVSCGTVLVTDTFPLCFDASMTGDKLFLVFPAPLGSSGSLGHASTFTLNPPPGDLGPPPFKLLSGTYSTSPLPPSAPEPSALLFVGVGLMILIGFVRLRSSAAKSVVA